MERAGRDLSEGRVERAGRDLSEGRVERAEQDLWEGLAERAEQDLREGLAERAEQEPVVPVERVVRDPLDQGHLTLVYRVKLHFTQEQRCCLVA